MKKKKPAPLTSIILLSFFLIILIFLLTLIPKKSLTPLTPPKVSSTPKSSFLSLLTLTSRPTSHFPPSSQISLIAVGDIMLGRYCNVQMLQKKDFKYPFLKTADLTRSADIAFGNLESPIVENCPTTETGMIFCARPEAIEGLKYAGFDILSLANNHILNHGQKGLDQTKLLLEKNNILSSQDNEITRYQVNNLSLGLLSFDLITYPEKLTFTHDREEITTIEFIKSAARDSDVLIISLHWGNEYQKTPTETQKDLAHQIIDAGAKVIIGHHPHVTQPTETYKNGLILYSLGNFVFDQPWSGETKKGQIAKIIFEGKNIKSYEIVPVYIQNYCQPQLVN